MSYVIDRKHIDLEAKGVTVEGLMRLLKIEEVSAKELLGGEIAFRRNEIVEIADELGIDAKELLGKTVRK